MLNKTLPIFTFIILANASPVFANPVFETVFEDKVSVNVKRISSAFASEIYSVKKDQPYSESSDPIFHSNGPETQSPQHGYFAVPLIVIGLAGILLYFSRNE